MIFRIIGKYFFLFIIYSFIGWCMETSFISIKNKKFVDRGFLIGPYCPIYGFGAITIILALNRFSYNPLLLFIMAIILCGLLEYMTSWIMEKLFKARWWDYSNRKVNLNGRICLENLIAFGILGMIVIYALNPVFTKWIESFNTKKLAITTISISFVYTIDMIISFIVIYGFRTETKKINIERKEDNTEQITKMVREVLFEKSFLHRRLLNAYPKLEAIKIRMKEIKTRIEDTTNNVKDAVAEKVNDAKEVVSEKTEEIKNNINQGKEKLKIYLNEKKIESEKFKGSLPIKKGEKDK